MKIRVSFSIEEQRLQELDKMRGHVPRSALVDLILEEHLKDATRLLKSH